MGFFHRCSGCNGTKKASRNDDDDNDSDVGGFAGGDFDTWDSPNGAAGENDFVRDAFAADAETMWAMTTTTTANTASAGLIAARGGAGEYQGGSGEGKKKTKKKKGGTLWWPFGGGGADEDKDPLENCCMILVEVVGAEDLDLLLDGRDNKKKLQDIFTKPIQALQLRRSGELVVDPYCVVKVRGEGEGAVEQEVHRTATIKDDEDPVWTIKTKSLCVVSIPDKAIPDKDKRDNDEGDGKPPADNVEDADDEDRGDASGADADKDANDDNGDEKGKEKGTCGGGAVIFEICHETKCIGRVTLSYETMLEGNGIRIEYPIVRSGPGADEGDRAGGHEGQGEGTGGYRSTLALRFRRATHSDLVFLGKVKEVPESSTSTSETYVTLQSDRSISKAQRNKQRTTPNKKCYDHGAIASDIDCNYLVRKNILKQYYRVKNGVEQWRILPYPDPTRIDVNDDSEWMSMAQMDRTMMEPSREWVHAGHGDMGVVYVEILACNNLPNMDAGGILGDVSDPFAALVFEDNIVRSDIFWDMLNPRWMPWTTRAFAFHVRHPASNLIVGVLDHDETALDLHDPMGRVVINLSNFEHRTDYVLHYPLHKDQQRRSDDQSSDATAGTPTASPTKAPPPGSPDSKGSTCPANVPELILRLRIEWEDEREALRLSYVSPPRFIINVKSDKSYQLVKYMTRGATDMDKATVETTKLYAYEFFSYWYRYCYFLDVIFEVLLWRGRLALSSSPSSSSSSSNDKPRTIWFPIHSVFLFVSVVTVIEYPRHAGPFFFYGIAYILLWMNYHLSNHPYHWKRVKSCFRRQRVLVFGERGKKKKKNRASEITADEAMEGWREGNVLDQLDKFKGERMSALIFALMYFMLRIYRMYSRTDISNIVITTPTEKEFWADNVLNINKHLYYVHMVFKYWCKYIRMYLNFINWKTYSTQIFTTNCIVIGTVWLILPANTIALWLIRAAAWTLLGPWMKLIDAHYVHPWYMTRDEILDDLRQGTTPEPNLPDFDAVVENGMFQKMSRSGRVVAEDALKLKHMREATFGRYSETVPMVDTSRYPSVPLPESTAQPARYDDDGAGGETADRSLTQSPLCDRTQGCHIPGQKLRGHMILTRAVSSGREDDDDSSTSSSSSSSDDEEDDDEHDDHDRAGT